MKSSRPFIQITPISKLDFGKRNSLNKQDGPSREKTSIPSSISLTKHFNAYIGNPDHLAELFESTKDSGIIRENDFLFAKRGLEWIHSHFESYIDFLHVPDLVFVYRIYGILCGIYSEVYPNWRFILGETPQYRPNNFNSMEFSMPAYEEFRSHQDTDFIAKFILEHLEKYNISNAIVSIPFFWIGELFQVFLIAEYLKKRGNIVILDATSANEQVDYTQWVENFTKDGDLLGPIDYFIPYQDYGAAMENIIHAVENNIPPEESKLQNVLYRDSQGGFMPFIRPDSPDEEVLYERFCRYFYPQEESGQKSFNSYQLSSRLFPYKCFWSGCFFCTINSTHLYPYVPKHSLKYITVALDCIEKHSILMVNFQDEAISPDDLILFAQEVLRRKMSFIYKVRTRFDARFTKEVCDLFYASGMRFCGIGLEAANQEINKSVNKGHNLTKDQISEVIRNFSDAGIPFHNYSIMGFPHETVENVDETFEFLSNNINTLPNYNCTPNIFGLNRGSYIYRHPEQFGISGKIPEIAKENLLNLRQNFERETKRSEAVAHHQEEIHHQQFFPWISSVKWSGTGTTFGDFWTFLDRASYYYLMKSAYIKSPFFLYRDINNGLLELSDQEILDTKIYVSPYIQIFRTQESDRYRIYNWVEYSHIFADKNMIGFFTGFDPNKTLRENIAAAGLQEDDVLFRILLQKRFLLSSVGVPYEYLDPILKSYEF